MQQKFGTCIQCKRENKSINSKQICSECTFRNNHQGKSQQEVYYERQKEKEKTQPKKIYQIKSKPIKQKLKKPTGEKELFLEIWNERPHYCTNPECRTYLGEEPMTYFFSHIKSKGAYPELRLVKSNIELLCFDCHFREEFKTKIKRE